MNLIEKATIRHYHNHRIAAYQNGSIGALGWRAEASQVKRFEVIATVGDLNGCAVLDIGCGYGDLRGFLDRSYSNFTYIGVDQMPQFIDKAKKRYGDCPATYFFQSDFTTVEFPTVDYVIASGALAYRCQNQNFHLEMIRKMYAAATRAVAFNMLDAACFPEDELLVGHDFDRVVAFCRQLSHRIQVLRGYLVDDFTIFMYKRRSRDGQQPVK
jgi:SAM-dependent methyltransferase